MNTIWFDDYQTRIVRGKVELTEAVVVSHDLVKDSILHHFGLDITEAEVMVELTDKRNLPTVGKMWQEWKFTMLIHHNFRNAGGEIEVHRRTSAPSAPSFKTNAAWKAAMEQWQRTGQYEVE